MTGYRLHHRRFFYLLVTPTVLVVAFLTLYPILVVFSNSLFAYDYVAGTRAFVGAAQYRAIASDTQFIQSVTNTAVFVVLAATLPDRLRGSCWRWSTIVRFGVGRR